MPHFTKNYLLLLYNTTILFEGYRTTHLPPALGRGNQDIVLENIIWWSRQAVRAVGALKLPKHLEKIWNGPFNFPCHVGNFYKLFKST